MILLDSHCDTPSQIVRLRDMSKRNELSHIDFPKLVESGVYACFFALYVPQAMPFEKAKPYVQKMIDWTKAAVASYPGVEMAGSVAQIRENALKGIASIIFGLENGMPIGDSLEQLEHYYKEGVRYVTLTHNGDNQIADSASQNSTWNGLSPFGRELIAKMNDLGMIVDCAHASDKTFFDALEASRTPVVSTHSCCRALASHRRNMDDKMLRALGDRGGVIQINFFPTFLSDDFARRFAESGLEDEADEIEMTFRADPSDKARREALDREIRKLIAFPRPSYKVVVDHIDHAVNVAGIESVGIGSDYDGIPVPPEGLEDVSKIGCIIDELGRRGYSDDAIEKIAGENFLRVMSEAEKSAK